MVGDEPSPTIRLSSTHLDPNPSSPHPGLLSQDFPCLPSNQFPYREPLNPNLKLSKEIPDSEPLTPSWNPWLKPPLLGQIISRKFVLRFIPPTARGTDQVGICPGEAVAGELKILYLTLAGFFVGKKSGFTYVRSNLLKQWKIRGSVQVLQLIQGGLAFRFSDIEDRDQILETGVFYVGGQPIFFRSWERNIHSGGILGLKQIPLWVSLPGLPLHLWGEDSLSAVCSVLGKPLYSDRITAEKSRWSFARACVEFSGSSPLLDSITIEDDMGIVFQQPVKYDWKPSHCMSCGIFGHIHDSCKRDLRGPEQEQEDAYGKKNQNLNTPQEDTVTQTNDDESSEIEKGMAKNANPDQLNLEKGKTFSELLQKRTSMLLRGWNPIRVKKTTSALPDPTRFRNSFQAQVQNSDISQAPVHVSNPGATFCGPNRWSIEMDGQPKPLSSPPFLEKNLNFNLPAPGIPPLTNRFGILTLDVDTSPCPQPLDTSLSTCDSDQPIIKEACHSFGSSGLPSEGLNRGTNLSNKTSEPHISEELGPEKIFSSCLGKAGSVSLSCLGTPSDSSALPDVSCPSPLDHSNVSIPEASLAQPPDPTPTPPHPLARKSGYRDQSCSCGEPSSLEPFLPGSTPTTPSFDSYLLDPGSSSIGRTPYHARSVVEDEDDKDEDEDEHNAEEEEDQLGRENEDKEAAIRKKSIGDDPEPLIEPIPYFNSADDKAEDIEEEVNEEDVGTEEDVDEDYEEKGKDNQLERKDAVEETARRKKLSNYGRYDDLWVTTNDLNDPRRINFW